MFKIKDKRHLVALLLTLLLFAWSGFVCYRSWIRLFESFWSWCLSIVYALFHKFEWCPAPNVNELSSLFVIGFFPQEWSIFCRNFRIYWSEFFSYYNFLSFTCVAAPVMQLLSTILLYVVLICAFVWLYLKFLHKPHQNTKRGGETPWLKRYKAYENRIERPLIYSIRDFVRFYFSYRRYRVVFWIVVVISLNAATVFFAFFSYYFYFCASFDFVSLALQIYKFTVDVLIAYHCLPVFMWVIIFFYFFDRITKSRAYDRLERHEWRNEQFLRTLGIVIFITGAMRTGKTSLVVDMLITKARIYRTDALDILLKIHSEFIRFPFPVFIKEANELFSQGKIKSLRQCERYMRARRRRFEKDPSPENAWGYDFEEYGLTFDNGLTVEHLFDRLTTWLKAYRIYKETTYFLTTFSVREDHIEDSIGNFSVWDMDIFHRDSFDASECEEYSHALNWDIIRPGKKMNPESKVFGVLEYGVLGVAELDKERENTLELKEVKKSDEECNQLNDLVERYLMMMGHSGMVEYKCFVSLFGDSQRETGWGAKGRETATVVKILENSEPKLALHFFEFRSMLYDFCKAIHKSSVVKNWYNRGDTTLRAYLLWKFTGKYINYCTRVYNTFGYEVSELSFARGDGEGDKNSVKWYRSYKKYRSGRYETASYKDYFGAANDSAEIKFPDVPRFSGRCPSLDELAEYLQSHFMNTFLNENSVRDTSRTRRKND